jgi:hypothetical protein
VIEQPPPDARTAAAAVVRSTAVSLVLIAGRRLHHPRAEVVRRLGFADGTTATVYRETRVDRGPATDPAVLLVEFRLRAVRGPGHRAFRTASLLNTVLFAGFPGFVSKLWLAHDEHGVYRGVYEWDGPDRAEDYARTLRRVLDLVSVPGSVHYEVLPELRRDDLLGDPHVLDPTAPSDLHDWWRLTEAS